MIETAFFIITYPAIETAKPDPAAFIHTDLQYFIVRQSVFGAKLPEVSAVEAIYAGVGTDPEKALPVLGNIIHIVAAQSFCCTVADIGAGLCKRSSAKEQVT